MLPTTQYSSHQDNLRFWLWDPKWNLQFGHCDTPPKTNMENQILDGLGRCFSSERGLFFSGFCIPHLCAAVAFKDLTDVRSICTREAWEGKPKTQHPRGGWKLFWAYFFWGVETQNSQWFFSVLKWRTFFEGDVLFEVVTDFDMCLPWSFGMSLLQMMGLSTPTPIFFGLCSIQQNGWEYQLCLYVLWCRKNIETNPFSIAKSFAEIRWPWVYHEVNPSLSRDLHYKTSWLTNEACISSHLGIIVGGWAPYNQRVHI